MKETAAKIIDTLTQEDFHGAISKLLGRYNKCISAGGDYIEFYVRTINKSAHTKKVWKLIKWSTYIRFSYLPTPPLGQDMTQGQFLSGV